MLEDIARATEGVEPLLDSYAGYAVGLMALFMSPILQVFLLLTDTTGVATITEIPKLYGIRSTDLSFYTIFSFVIIPATLCLDIFLFNTLELVHGWRLYDYISYQKYRFSVREERWLFLSQAYDESISEGLQSTDLLCFSSQYYFIMSLFAFAIFMSVVGISIHMRIGYNLFGDQMTYLIIILTHYMVKFFRRVFLFFANVFGLWKLRGVAGTLADDIAAKLAIGEIDHNLEQERLELQAMNSERFRHRFLDKNRPWILQHLTELLTPRTLQMPGVDGRPHIEYIRDVYTDLMHMQAGSRMPGDREDISTDSEDDDLEMKKRRNWSKAPIAPRHAEVMRFWLRKARMRRKYAKLVQGLIDSNEDDKCHTCSRTKEGGFSMRVEVATEGEVDDRALDKLIADYEAANPRFDENGWKAYFRKHATYVTRCSVCVNLVEMARAKARRKRHPGDTRKTRADDLSSDSDDELRVAFAPIVVARSSAVGKLMQKWLVAARRYVVRVVWLCCFVLTTFRFLVSFPTGAWVAASLDLTPPRS